jgi:hypothetical protein
MRHITRLSDYQPMAIGLLFFLLLDNRNIEYRIGEFKKLLDPIGYRTQKNQLPTSGS